MEAVHICGSGSVKGGFRLGAARVCYCHQCSRVVRAGIFSFDTAGIFSQGFFIAQRSGYLSLLNVSTKDKIPYGLRFY